MRSSRCSRTPAGTNSKRPNAWASDAKRFTTRSKPTASRSEFMNNFDEPLATLKAKVLAGGDFGAIMNYFFDACAEKPKFIELGKPIKHAKLEAILPQILSVAAKKPLQLTR